MAGVAVILCVNPNASVDRSVLVDGFQVGAVHRPRTVLPLPGGKGCNVARALKTLAEDPVVTGWAGGYNGRYIESGLRAEGITPDFVRIQAESRMCLSIADPTNLTLTEIFEPGPPVSARALAAFLRRYRALLPRARLVTLSGSVPPGVPLDFYATLIAEANAAGVPSCLDAAGELLRLGLAARPHLIKPNRDELAGLIGRACTSPAGFAEAARALSAQYGALVVVSLGRDGAVAAQGAEAWAARPPAVAALMTTGSGDAMLAALAAGLLAGAALPDLLRRAVAVGTANTLCLGTGRFLPADVTALAPRISVERL